MRTSETLLLDFIKQSPQFRIPVNQRRYAWTRRHCRQLWDDILDAGERQDVREHFLGPIMYVAAVDPLNAHWCCFARYLTTDFPDCFTRSLPGFPTLFDLCRSDAPVLTVSEGGAVALSD